MAMSAAPVVPHDVDPDPKVEFVPTKPAPVGPEHAIAHEPIDAPAVALLPDPLPEPDHVDIPDVAPPVIDAPVIVPPVPDVLIVDAPVISPPVVDHAPFATHIDPRYANIMGGLRMMMTILHLSYQSHPLLHLFFEPVDVLPVHPHVSDVHRTDLPITFLQDIPQPRLGEGPSTGPHDHMPPTTAAFPFMPSFTPVAHTTSPFTPAGEPLM
ncbi:proline-rich extensin-like protein EPR1 [Helianthus annuus]|uniref:proline-rich extensin-like protein EPR1 n=1 Tax=Helianthus annuus TaxID=4232 RepID=UPI000B90770D|nr:proline-rich extensin-like protein EPR1 [Helianthus annuus]